MHEERGDNDYGNIGDRTRVVQVQQQTGRARTCLLYQHACIHGATLFYSLPTDTEFLLLLAAAAAVLLPEHAMKKVRARALHRFSGLFLLLLLLPLLLLLLLFRFPDMR